MDIKKLVAELSSEKKTDRKQTSIYVSQAVWEKFRKITKAAGASLILEKFMEEVIQEGEKKK